MIHPLVSFFICWAQLVLVLKDVCPPLLAFHPEQAGVAGLPGIGCPHASDSDLIHLTPASDTHTNIPGTVMSNMESTTMITGSEHGNHNTSHSSSDLILLITRYCDKMMHENIKEEGEHTNEKIKMVIRELSEVTKHIKNQDSKLEDINIKIDTMYSYQEQLLFSLKAGLQDTFKSVYNDIEQVQTKVNTIEDQITNPCLPCEQTFSQPEAYPAHHCSQHSTPQQNMFACHICSELQTNQHDLIIHLQMVHDKK